MKLQSSVTEVYTKKRHSKAIVSIVYGGLTTQYWEQFCKKTWLIYAAKYQYDILIVTETLDNSERAKKRSVSWQKCLILSIEEVKRYERVVWVDADVVINPATAPCIVSTVPLDKIGGTDAYSFFNKPMHDYLYQEYIQLCKKEDKPLIVNLTASDYYKNYGIDTDLDEVIQAGVLVFTPHLHEEVLLDAYGYEQKTDPASGYEYNYEMRPLSYEIVSRNLHFFIDNRFNLIVSNFLYLSAPFLYHKPSTRGFDIPLHTQLAVSTAYAHSFFLHFAGNYFGKELTNYLLERIQKPEDFSFLA